jgi:hypothetical protein
MVTVADWYREAGPLMPHVTIVGVLAALLAAERTYAILLRARGGGRPFMERSIQLVRSGKLDDAIAVCSASRSALADIGLLILRSRAIQGADLREVAHAAELSLVPRLRHRLRYLPALGIGAVLLGVIGLVSAIDGAGGRDAASWQTIARAGGALRPLELGLAVLAAALFLNALLRDQADTVADEVREFAARLINALAGRPDVRLGHR